MGLRVTGSCSCHIAYIYPKDIEDGRCWFVAINTDSSGGIHNHPPSEWKIVPKVLSDISNAVSRNPSISPKELQKGVGMEYRPMEVSLPTASLGRMRAIV